MSHKQQLMVWIGGSLLLLTAVITGIMFLFQREPDAGLPSESTALSTVSTTASAEETTTSASMISTTAAESTTSASTCASTETTAAATETSAETTTATASTPATQTTIMTEITHQTTVKATEIPAHTEPAATSAAEPTATEASSTEPPPPQPPATDPPATEPPAVTPTYIDGVLIVNKTYALPADYNPGLDPTCKSQFDLLSQAAAAEGLNIYLSSGFRSYDRQKTIYNNYLNWYGQEKTDTLSARPGHSEHQTGLAIDVNSVTDSFGATPEAAWLAAHAHEFGFIIRYPKGKEHITGYKYEPWHIRYLGVDMAATIYNSGLTLEEYFGITSCYAE